MKRGAIIGTIAGAVLVAGIAGGAVGATLTSSQEPAPTTSAEPTPSATAMPEALVAETPAAADPLSEADAVFLAYVEEQTPTWTTTKLPDLSETELITAGHEACEQIAAGVPSETLRLVEDEEPSPMGDFVDSSAIFNGAITAYCPELVHWPKED